MRPIHLSSILCALASSVAAIAGGPGPFDIETIIADGMWNNRSSVEIDADGVAHVVWAGQFGTDSSTAEVYYANNAPGNGDWAITQLTFNDVREEFPCLTLDQDGNVHVAVHTGVPGGNHIRYINNAPGNAPPGEFNDWINITPPSGLFYVIVKVRVDSTGVAHLTFRSQTSATGEDVFYTTWSEKTGVGPLVNISQTPGAFAANSQIAIGPDDAVHLIWTAGLTSGPLMYKKNEIGGEFTTIPTGVAGSVNDPMIQVSDDNIVSIIYRQSNVLWLIEDDGGGFSAPQPLFTGVTALPAFYERFALDADGRRHIAFSSNSQELRGVWYIGESKDGFDEPIKIDGENTGNQSTSIAIGPDGAVVVTYSLSGFDQVVFADLFAATLESDTPAPCPGDLTGSGTVGVPDLLLLLGCWGPVAPGCEAADLTDAQNVGVPDLLALLAEWGACP